MEYINAYTESIKKKLDKKCDDQLRNIRNFDKDAKKPNILSTYEDGVNAGYEQAKFEFRRQCLKSIQNNMAKADFNLELLESNKTLDDYRIEKSLLLWALPQWELKVFGETYVVRTPPASCHRYAWIVPKKESDELHEKLEKVVLKSMPDLTLIQMQNMMREKRKKAYL